MTNNNESTSSRYDIVVGDYVVAGRDGDTDCDWGEIIEIADDGETATIAWQIGACETDVRLADNEVNVYEHSDTAKAECDARREIVDRSDDLPSLPGEIHVYQCGGVRCCYPGLSDSGYDSDDDAAADHQVSARAWARIKRVSVAGDRPLTVDEIRGLTPDQAWERYVGQQGVSEFVDYGGIAAEYVNDSQTTEDHDEYERRAIAERLQEMIDKSA